MTDGGDRRGAGQDPDGDGYDWLYSSSTGRPAPPPEDDGESTRVLSTQPRPGNRDRAPRGEDAPPTRIAPTPGTPSRRPPPARTGGAGKKRSPWRWLVVVLVAWVVYLVAVPVWAWFSVSKVDAEPSGDRPADQPGTTYLVVGSDARAGLAGRRTDTIMLLHVGSGPNLLMSVPRDSLVEVPGHGTTKINAAFAYGGPKLLVKTVEQDTGIRVDHYVEIGFTGFVKLVDAVGGITICPKTAMQDKLAELDIPKGCQEADGKTALGYARSRHTQQLGDIGRAEHQREVVSAIGSEVVSWKTLVNPVRYWRVVFGGAESVRVSKGTGPIDAARFAYAMTRVNGKDGLTCGVPISDLAVHWDSQRAPALFKLIQEDRTKDVGKDLCSPSGIKQ
jgi:LCP family protein required for cell wall assembly